MFTVFCPRHDAVVLIWPSGIDRIVNGDAGIEVHYHCLCGHNGVWLTGRRRTPGGDPAPGGRARTAA